jgi:integrase
MKKEPILPHHLLLLVEKYGNKNSCLPDLRIITICLLGYSGFLRFSEIVNIKRSDISIYDQHISIFISRSKTDRYNEGSNVYIAKTGSNTCPVNMLYRYLDMAGIECTSDEHIFRQITYLKKSNSYKLRNTTKPLSYTRVREIILSALEEIGLDKKNFGLHSLRSGGATAATAADINDRILKKHGRWKSDKAKDGYVKENLFEKLSVSKNLGI